MALRGLVRNASRIEIGDFAKDLLHAACFVRICIDLALKSGRMKPINDTRLTTIPHRLWKRFKQRVGCRKMASFGVGQFCTRQKTK